MLTPLVLLSKLRNVCPLPRHTSPPEWPHFTSTMPAIPPIALCLTLIAIFLRLLASPFHSNNVFVEPSLHDVLLPKDSHISSAGILLLTAHPDDECFFFGPTLTALLSQENQPGINDDPFSVAPRVYSLCLSVGDADGLGELRRNEFEKSWDVMGVPRDRRWLLDHECVFV